MTWLRNWVLLALCILTTPAVFFAQQPAISCAVTPISRNKNQPNIFSTQQEIELGEVIADFMRDNRFEIDDPDLNARLQDIGNGLVKRLPPSGLTFRFYLSNMPDANAFSIAGGRIYVSRKLIAITHSEDDLAAVLAHELGHVITHQGAVDFTRHFKAIGVTQVSDQKDINEKFHRLLESNSPARVDSEAHQLQADRVGLEVLALAGYDVEAMPSFYDRLTNNEGRKGNWFTDLLGSTGPDTKRFREMEKTLPKFPASCIDRRPDGETGSYRRWQAAVVAYAGTGRHDDVPGLLSRKVLEPPLQDEIHTLRFSFDGRHLLAQDDANIYVLTRDPLTVKFRVEAPEAYPAQFTVDSRFLTFYTPALHAEVWNVDEGRREAAFEMVSHRGCLQTALSSDAKTLACVDARNDLLLIDSASGDRIFEKKQVRQGSSGLELGLGGMRYSYELQFVNMGFSLDGRYLLVSSKYGTFAVEIAARREMPLNGTIKSFLHGGFVFLADGRIVGSNGNFAKAAVLSFPDGRVEHEIELGAAVPSRVAKGDYVLLRPIRDYAVGVLDLKSNTIVRASKTPALDLYNDIAASVLQSGEVALFGTSAKPLASVMLPRGHIGSLQSLAFSDDFGWLAASTRARGAVWNLSAGTRLYNLKGFRGACFEDDGLYVDFPKQSALERSIVRVNLQHFEMTLAQKIGDGTNWQECKYLLKLRPANAGAREQDNRVSTEDMPNRYEGSQIRLSDLFESLRENEILEVKDVATGALLWTRKFDKSVPRIFSNPSADVAALAWRLGAEGANAEAKNIKNAAMRGSTKNSYDYVVEVLELATGKVLGGVIVNTGNGSFRLENVVATPDWVAVEDTFGRTLIYSLKTGECIGKLFGKPRLISKTGILAVDHGTGHAALYNLATMKKQEELVFSFPISGAAFNSDGSRLLVLTADQAISFVDISARNSRVVTAGPN